MPSCNCTNEYEAIEANPDVAGLGVVISFMLTAHLTFFALLYGYISDSIPDTTINRIDYLVVEHVRKLLALSPLRAGFSQEQRDSKDTEANRQAKCRRSSALERFVLALSDQQLVTGIAILTAGYIKPCSMDWYHFQVIAALAWFSSTTHLSTLALVRDYLINHPLIRTWRVAGMIVMLIMILVAQFFVFTLGQENPSVYCTTKSLSFSADPVTVVNLFSVLSFLLLSYGSNIVRLYSNDSNISLFDWVLRMVEDKLGRTITIEPQRIDLHTDKLSLASKKGAGKEHRQRERDASLNMRLHSFSPGPFVRGENVRIRIQAAVLTRFWISIYLLQEINESFLGKILWLTFGHAYGIIKICRIRWLSHGSFELVGNENEMGFGQIVPLLLMLLPLLAAGEAYYDLRSLPMRNDIPVCGDSSTMVDIIPRTELRVASISRDATSVLHKDDSFPNMIRRATIPIASDNILTTPVRTHTESGLENNSTMKHPALQPTPRPPILSTRTLSHTSASSQALASEAVSQRNTPLVKNIEPYSIRLLKTYAVIIIVILFLLYILAACILNDLFFFYYITITILVPLMFGFYTCLIIFRFSRLFIRTAIKRGLFRFEKAHDGNTQLMC